MNDITNIFASYFSSVYDTNNFIDTDLIDMPNTHSQHFFFEQFLDQGYQVDSIYTDFEKAFDKYTFLKRVAFITHCTISRDSFFLVQNSIGIDSLNVRHDLIDIMFVYDILNNNINCPSILNLIGFRIPSRAIINTNRITVLSFFVLSRQLCFYFVHPWSFSLSSEF
ncbi:hypothetical protein QTP88_019865 [Uroleucon formosanum]